MLLKDDGKESAMESRKLKKFYVAFYHGDDDELDRLVDRDPDFDEDAWNDANTYRNEIEMNCALGKFYAWASEHADEIRAIEMQYGVLDGEGMGNDMGYSSYEISLEDAPVVWEKLVNMLKDANLIAE